LSRDLDKNISCRLCSVNLWFLYACALKKCEKNQFISWFIYDILRQIFANKIISSLYTFGQFWKVWYILKQSSISNKWHALVDVIMDLKHHNLFCVVYGNNNIVFRFWLDLHLLLCIDSHSEIKVFSALLFCIFN